MNKKLLGLLVLVGLSWLYAESKTTRVGLTKPDLSSTGWATKTNTNWDILDSSAAIQGAVNTFIESNHFVGPVTIDSGTITKFNSPSSTITVLNVSTLNVLVLNSSTMTVSSITAPSAAVASLLVSSINGSWPNPNILINGGFEFWQRGSTFTALANATYGADRWKIITDEASGVTLSTDTATLDRGIYAAKIKVTGAGANKYWYLQQKVENYSDYAGLTLSVSVRVKTDVANAITLQLYDGATATNSSYHSGSGSWETLTITKVMAANTSELSLFLGMIQGGDKNNGTYYIDSAMLVAGNQAISFIPTKYPVELSQCQRYFWRSHDEFVGIGHCTTTTTALVVLRHPVTMRTSPTCTITGPTNFALTIGAGADNTSAMAVGTLTPNSCAITATLTAGLTANNATACYSDTGGYLDFDAEM